jgi:aminoglycoside phosphotransferase (APT) family kinase protein
MPEWSAEVVVDEAAARSLIEAGFPQLAGGQLQLLGEGWDSTVWLLDGRWVFRFPRREVAVPGLRRELEVLPQLAPRLPAAVPEPVFVGEPGAGFPWPWAGSSYIPGRELADAALGDDRRITLAGRLARFLRVLHDTDPAAVGRQLPIDPVRRSDMPFRVEATGRRLAQLQRLGIWHAPAAAKLLLERALALGPPAAPVLVHGDLHLRHLLVGDDGGLAGVIDWIDVCRADPAIDLPLYWAALPSPARRAFLDEYGPVTDEQLVRARVLAVFLCATLAEYAAELGMEPLRREALAGLDRSLLD